MKKMLSALAFLLAAGVAHAQWTTVQTPITQSLNDIFFATPAIGYCVGDSGTALKTTNGGASWTLLPGFTTDGVEEVYFKNADTGWVRTHKNIFQTTNGGASFQSLEPVFGNADPAKVQVLAYMSFRKNTGIVIGSFTEQPQQSSFMTYSKITRDGGRTWHPVTLPVSYTGVFNIVNDSVFFAAGSVLYKTRNGGASWDTFANVQFSFPPLNNKCFQIFDTAGNGVASLAYHMDYVRLQAQGGTVQALPLISLWFLTNLAFPNRDTGYALKTSSGAYYLHKTTDGGASYQKLTADSAQINNLFFPDTQTGFLCGRGGKIYKITNGGISTAVKDLTAESGIAVYPNPAKGMLSLKTDGAAVHSLALADVSGRVARTFPNTAETLDISGIAPGVYWLLIESKDRLITRKVVLE